METTHLNEKEIICLLLADMRNRKLILGLEAAGLYSEDFYTDLAALIFSALGFPGPEDEALSFWYEETIEFLIDKELPYFKEHQQALAEKMFKLLLLKKHSLQPFCSPDIKKGILRLFDDLKVQSMGYRVGE